VLLGVDCHGAMNSLQSTWYPSCCGLLVQCVGAQSAWWYRQLQGPAFVSHRHQVKFHALHMYFWLYVTCDKERRGLGTANQGREEQFDGLRRGIPTPHAHWQIGLNDMIGMGTANRYSTRTFGTGMTSQTIGFLVPRERIQIWPSGWRWWWIRSRRSSAPCSKSKMAVKARRCPPGKPEPRYSTFMLQYPTRAESCPQYHECYAVTVAKVHTCCCQ
jgi:hypothetical protein